MPTFPSPEPISATVSLVVGEARITASDRNDTIVDVRPSDSTHEADVRAAEQTRVEYADGRLLVKAPKPRGLSRFGRTGSVDVTIELPTGSRLEGDAAVAAFRCVGRLGESRVKTSAGDIQIEESGGLRAHSGAGTVDVGRVAGSAEGSTGSGKVRVRLIEGGAVIKNSNGDCWIGEVGGNARVTTANGDVAVDRAGADVTATTANGDVRVSEVARGSHSFKTAMGQIEIGIRTGTAARLDVHTSFGRVRNDLDPAGPPESSGDRADVHAHTSYGDVVIRRSQSVQ